MNSGCFGKYKENSNDCRPLLHLNQAFLAKGSHEGYQVYAIFRQSVMVCKSAVSIREC